MVYFSLAAVALFGLGQLCIPATDLAARRYAFQLLFLYTASGLGLLLTTSFLGLRRYLRQRRQEMPLRMVNLWLPSGAVLIVGVMLSTMLLPRPNPEYAISELPFRFGSPDQKSSPHGVGNDGVKENQPWARGQSTDGKSSGAAPTKPTESSQNRPKMSKDRQTRLKQESSDSNSASADSNTASRKSPETEKSPPDHEKQTDVTRSQKTSNDSDKEATNHSHPAANQAPKKWPRATG